MFDKLFQPGNRKLLVTLVGVLLTMFGDKLGITMDEKMQETIVYLVGIFTGGNVLSKVAYAASTKKETVEVRTSTTSAPPLEEAEESLTPVGELEARINNTFNYAKKIAEDATKELNNVHSRCKAIEDHMAKQSTTINQLLAMINQQVLPALNGRPVGPVKVPPAGQDRVPTPNELYNQG